MIKSNKNKKIIKLNIKDIIDIIQSTDTEEDNQIIQTDRIKAYNIKNKKFLNESNDYILYNTIKRSNSVDLYKKRNNKKNNLEYNKSENDNYISIKHKDNENFDNKKNIKKVTFKNPDYLTIIDVESYKKYNAENTAKDPYDELMNNDNDNDNDNNNNNEKKKKKKENVVCSCLIF